MPKMKRITGLQKPVKPSPELAAIIGSAEISRGEVVSRVWQYIKENNLQNPANRREILPDAKLKRVFDGQDKLSMFAMNKYLFAHTHGGGGTKDD